MKKFFAAAGDAKIVAVVVREIAAAAAAALMEMGHEGRTYDLTGPEALTHHEMAEKLSHAVGREIQYIDVLPEAMREALLGVGLPLWQADGLIEDYAHYRRGEASAIAPGVQVDSFKPRSRLFGSHLARSQAGTTSARGCYRSRRSLLPYALRRNAPTRAG